MAERQPFRFRLPWLNMPPPPRPTTTVETEAPPRPAAETQVPTRPTPTVPVQRPPFRPPGIAPVQPPPPSLSPPRNEPQPPTSPPRAAIESRTASQPVSPSRLATERATSQPASPSRLATERATSQPASPLSTAPRPRAASLPPSPSRATPQSRPPSVPSSPSHIASHPQSPLKTTPQPRSPPRLTPQPAGRISSQPSSPSRIASRVQPTAEEISQPPRILTQPTPFATKQEEQEPALPQPDSRESPITEIRPETGADSQKQPPVETTTQPDMITTQHSEASGLVVAAIPSTALQPLPDSTENPEETKEGPNLVQEQRKENELNWPPKHKKDTEIPTLASNSEKQTKEPLIVDFKEQKEVGKQEILGEKETSSPSDSSGRAYKTGHSAHAKERNHEPAFLNRERIHLHKEIREDISKFVHKLGTGHLNQTVTDKPTNVINLAGENRGASMQLGTESGNKERPVHIRRGYITNPDESLDATTDAEGSSRGRRSKDSMTKEDQAAKAYINSNVQSINNSIVFNSSVSEMNPGVQLDFPQNPTQPIGSTAKTESLDTRKAEFNITPAEKLTYHPTVRRRCLRGLFMEPSDSDPDTPDKPRRHGCPYGSWEKGENEDIGFL